MDKKIEDYLHLYLGCECANEFFPKDHEEYRKGWKLTAIDRSSFRPYKLETNYDFTWTKEVRPILRPLSDMKENEKAEYNQRKQRTGYMFQIHADNTLWLLNKGFDLFNLISTGLAIDSTTLNQNNE